MIGVGTSLLFGKRAGKAGPPIPPFNKAMVDAWFMSGFSNNDKPSSIRGVKGNEMALKNFAYSLSSGFGKYEVDFTKYIGSNTTSNSISIHKEAGTNKGFATIYYSQLESDIPSYSIEIKGLDSGQILYYYRNNEGLEKNVTYNKDGIYELPICYKEGEKGISAGFTINSVNNITITQLPSAYEGALVFDGVDDYGICTGLPIMDDFTLICKREILNTSPGYVANKGLGNAGAFHFESSILTSDSNSTTGVWSYGTGNRVKLEESEVSWMTKNSYNGIELKTGNLSDVDQLYLCRFSSSYTKAAIYYFALYNKSLTPEEIEVEKERLNEEWLKRKTE
jgi:hypothetical protein